MKKYFLTDKGLVVECPEEGLDIEHLDDPYSLERVLSSKGVRELLSKHAPDDTGIWEIVSEDGYSLGYYHGTVRGLINKTRYIRKWFLHDSFGHGGYYNEISIKELEDVMIPELEEKETA